MVDFNKKLEELRRKKALKNQKTQPELSKEQETMSIESNLPEVIESNLPAVMSSDMFEADAGDGVAYGMTDVAIPFISVLQTISPQCKKVHAKYVKGAEEGMLYNTVTGQLYDGASGIEIIQGAYEKVWIEWKPRSLGGGFVGVFQPGDPIISTTTRNEKNEAILANGNELKETAQYFILVKDPETGDYGQAMLSLTKSNLKVSRTWNSLTSALRMKNKEGKSFAPPVYAYRYCLSAALQSKGDQTWYTFRVENVGPVQDRTTYEAAKKFSADVRIGQVKVNHDAVAEGGASDSTEDLPF